MFNKFKQYKKYVKTKPNKWIKVLRSDNGGEYKANGLINFCQINEISRQSAVPNTAPAKNEPNLNWVCY